MLFGTNVGGGGEWKDVIWVSGYGGGDVKLSNALVFGKTYANIGFVQQNYDGTSWRNGGDAPVWTSTFDFFKNTLKHVKLHPISELITERGPDYCPVVVYIGKLKGTIHWYFSKNIRYFFSSITLYPSVILPSTRFILMP